MGGGKPAVGDGEMDSTLEAELRTIIKEKEEPKERREKLSAQRNFRFMEIDDNKLVGKVITVKDGETLRIEGELTFKYNQAHGGNTGYYVGDTQIPLLQIKEVGGNYLRV